jgi:hypothetical protein
MISLAAAEPAEQTQKTAASNRENLLQQENIVLANLCL